ncbi:SDR family NAD(P)-dependent oxidoreductase [Flavobacterium sp.]|uniref:SDR family NAD(P)-dependent oxidoreductase n=1 Tax=Flavobacterium sp. TaxID=239 RepID=UPI0025C662D2|nr:SDR family NAD(P)-dependent oxidoreductase [Flavobacterium sp.]
MNISLLGCGWLGLPLAQHLIATGHVVKGSTTSIEKLAVLKSCCINPYLIALNEDKIEGDVNNFLLHSEILVIDIPPKLRGLVKENFVQKITNLIPYIEQSTIKKVLFISSTSVYADTENLPTITEETIPNPDTESGKQLYEVEQMLQSNTQFKTTILRFGGLIGTNRNPINMLAGRTDVANPEAPINFIHQTDCIGVIEAILNQNSWNEIYNAIGLEHFLRKNYYSEKAKELGLTPPQFNFEKISLGKYVSNAKIKNQLGYTFKVVA